MIYLVLTVASGSYADDLSRALYTLTRPELVRDADDVTTYQCGVIAHPISGDLALQCSPDDMPIHADAVATTVADVIQPHHGAGAATAAQAAANARRGQRSSLSQVLPPSFASRIRSDAQMLSDGWFGEQD